MDSPVSLEWDNYCVSPTYKLKMTVQHSPVNKAAAESATTHDWTITIEGQKQTVTVNSNQHEYLNLPETTMEQKREFLLRILEEQKKNTAEAEAEAANQPEDLKQTPPVSPTPTEQSLEIIKSRTEESKAEENYKAEDKGADACRDRHHIFEYRTKTDLAPVAKRFINACNALTTQLDRTKFADEVSKQYGDELITNCRLLYEDLEAAREYCLEPLMQHERAQYTQYLMDKFNQLQTCERIHRSYFEKQVEDKQRRQQESQQTQPPPMFTSTPFHQPPPKFVPPHGQHGQQQSGAHYVPPQQQYGQQQHGQQQQSGTHYVPPHQQYGQQANFSHQQQQQQNPHPGFNIYDQEDRIPTPSEPSVINERPRTRFKLKEELSLVEKFDASVPRQYMAFRAQWSNFHMKMEQEQRSNLDLYYALLQVLGGTAKELANTKYPNNQSYSQAINKLDELFYNPTNLLRDMVQNLLKSHKMNDSYESLLGGMNKLWDAWNDLDQADLTKEQLKGLLFIAATEKNLSEESWKCWLEVQNDPKYKQNPMEAFEITAYLGAINKAMLNAQKRKNAIGAKEHPTNTPPKTNKPGKKQSTMFGSYSNTVANQAQDTSGNNQSKTKVQQQARGSNNTCVTCGNTPHKYQLNCPKLRDMTPNQIYKVMSNSNIECQMCLGLGHRSKDCPAVQDGFLKKCTIKENSQECGKYHCRYLHKPKNSTGVSNQTPKTKQE